MVLYLIKLHTSYCAQRYRYRILKAIGSAIESDRKFQSDNDLNIVFSTSPILSNHNSQSVMLLFPCNNSRMQSVVVRNVLVDN